MLSRAARHRGVRVPVMSHSQHLRLSDVRHVFRLLGDVRDLRHDYAAQEKRVLDGICELVGAQQGFAVRFEDFRPGRVTRISRFLASETSDAQMLRFGAWFNVGDNLSKDVMTVCTRSRPTNADAISRSSLLSYRDWQDWQVFEAFVDPSRILDTLVVWFRYPGTDRIRGYSVQRNVGYGEYKPRHVRIARLLATEMFRLYREGRLEPPAAVEDLPPRLRQIVPLLVTGLSQKQIAQRTGLTYHTVRSYTKQLYDLLGVHSREQLMVTFIHERGV